VPVMRQGVALACLCAANIAFSAGAAVKRPLLTQRPDPRYR